MLTKKNDRSDPSTENIGMIRRPDFERKADSGERCSNPERNRVLGSISPIASSTLRYSDILEGRDLTSTGTSG